MERKSIIRQLGWTAVGQAVVDFVKYAILFTKKELFQKAPFTQQL